jgi:acyl carrier protein
MGEDRILDELRGLLVETLHLDDLTPESIDPDAPLFGDGLGLDSIDALELSLAISRNYGVTISSEDPNIRTLFASLRNLADHIGRARAA